MKLSLLAVLGVMAFAPATASAATITVKETNDAPLAAGVECGAGEGCTLRAAIELADETGGASTIELPAGTYALSEGALWIEDGAQVTVHGGDAATTTIEGAEGGVLRTEAGGELTVQDVTVTGGQEGVGGGLYAESDGAVTIEGSVVTKNEAALGGGVFGEEGSSVTVRESTVTGNGAAFAGGGVAMDTGQFCDLAILDAARSQKAGAQTRSLGTARPFAATLTRGLTISRSTIEGNETDFGPGGGIFAGSGCVLPEIAKAAGKSLKSSTGARPASIAEEEGGLTIDQTTIANNLAEGPMGIGGGVYEETRLLPDPIVNSTITGNKASFTGGGLADADGETILVSDTISGNTATGELPGEEEVPIGARPSWRNARPDAKPNVAAPGFVVDNLAAEPENEEARIELRNTIVATSGGRENCEGAVEALPNGGYNLDFPSTREEGASADTCGMSEADKDLVNVDPQLDPAGLQANGGPTRTIALLGTSPAIGVIPIVGDCADSEDGPALPNAEGEPVPVDQRGEPRPGIAGRGCDVGAYEYQAPAVKEEVKAPAPTPPASGVLGVTIASPVCASKRQLTIHIQNAKHFGIVSAVVRVNGKVSKLVRGHLSEGINLVGLPKGTFTVSIVARTRSGKTLHGKRVYHTCHTRLPGHVSLRL